MEQRKKKGSLDKQMNDLEAQVPLSINHEQLYLS